MSDDITTYHFRAGPSAFNDHEDWEEDFVRVIGWLLIPEGWNESGRIYFDWIPSVDFDGWDVIATRYTPEPWTGRTQEWLEAHEEEWPYDDYDLVVFPSGWDGAEEGGDGGGADEHHLGRDEKRGAWRTWLHRIRVALVRYAWWRVVY